MNKFNVDEYSKHYDFEELNQKLKKNNTLDVLDKDINIIFKHAIQFGLLDLIEYIYVWHNLEYELEEVTSKFTTNLSLTDLDLKSVDIFDRGASNGMQLNYYSNKDIYLQKSINKLYSMRKYSKMRSANKKFYYKFNPKYKYIFEN